MQMTNDAVAAGAAPLEWEDRREGCWHGVRNGRIIVTILSRPDDKWQWSLRGVNSFGISKSVGREASLGDAMAAAQSAWDRWCEALKLTAA